MPAQGNDIVARIEAFNDAGESDVSGTLVLLLGAPENWRDWIEAPLLHSIGQIIEALLNSGFKPEQIAEFAAAARNNNFSVPGSVRDPGSFIRDVDRLGFYQWAVSLGPQDGLAALAGRSAARGHKTVQSAKEGHEKVHGTKSEKEARWAKFASDCVEIARRNPLLSQTDVHKRVATANGVSARTVRRHTPPLRVLLRK